MSRRPRDDSAHTSTFSTINSLSSLNSNFCLISSARVFAFTFRFYFFLPVVHFRQVSELEFNVPFQYKHGYVRDERSGMESYAYPVKEGWQYINLNPGHLFVQQPPKKRERDREAHLNYYASTYNRGDNNRITRLKLNRHELNKHASLIKNTANINTKQTKPRFGRLLRPPAWK